MKKLFLFTCITTLQLCAGEPPKEPMRDTREIQIFEDCSNEECYEYCQTTADILCNPLTIFALYGEVASNQMTSCPFGIGGLSTASVYLSILFCCSNDTNFVDDECYSSRMMRFLKEKSKGQNSNFFQSIAQRLAQERSANQHKKKE